MDYSPPGSSVHRTLQARILERVAMPASRGSSQSRDRMLVSCLAGRFFTTEPPGNHKAQLAPFSWCGKWGNKMIGPEQYSSFETGLGDESKSQNPPVVLYLLNDSDLWAFPHDDDNSFHLLMITVVQVLEWVLYYVRSHIHPSQWGSHNNDVASDKAGTNRLWMLTCVRHCAKPFTFIDYFNSQHLWASL